MNLRNFGNQLCMARKKDGTLCSRPRLNFELTDRYIITHYTCGSHRDKIPSKWEKRKFINKEIK
jgi:hypothetical protein